MTEKHENGKQESHDSGKPESPFKPQQGVPAASGIGSSPSDWNPYAKPLDGSPVKTAVQPPPGYRPGEWRPKTVAEHNAEVDRLSQEAYHMKQ